MQCGSFQEWYVQENKRSWLNVRNIPCLFHNTELCSHVPTDLKEKSPGPIRKKLEKESHDNTGRIDEQLIFTAIPMYAINLRLTTYFIKKEIVQKILLKKIRKIKPYLMSISLEEDILLTCSSW